MKNGVHVLPNNPQSIEDFEWLRTEVAALGGRATIVEASSISGIQERSLINTFRRRAGDRSSEPKHASADAPPTAELDRREYRHRTWVTRPRPGVDRFSSAWFIRRFVDPQATFVFADTPAKWRDAVAFDMYQTGGFRHEGDRCTFEVLVDRFAVRDDAIRQIAEIVHDLDLKDDRFRHPHAATIGVLVEGLRASIAEDRQLLEQGIAMFEALYQSFRPTKGRTKGIC